MEGRADTDERLASFIPEEINLHTNFSCNFMTKEHNLPMSAQSYSTRTDQFVPWNTCVIETAHYSFRADMVALFSKFRTTRAKSGQR